MNIISGSGHAPSALDAVRAELSGLLRSGTLEIPSLPEQVAGLLEYAARPHASTASLIQLVNADAALASRVLKVTQFAAYQPNSPIDSLDSAVGWLGAGEVVDIAVTAAVQGLLFDAAAVAPQEDASWRSAIAAAIWSREIGAVSRRRSEFTYLCGLLHDIGRPFAWLTWRDLAGRLGVRASTREADAFVHETRQALGLAIARKWSLPAPVKVCIEGWASWTADAQADGQVAVIHLAHHLAEIVLQQGPEFAREVLARNPVLDELNITPDRLTALLDRAPWVMNQVRAY